MATFKSFEEIDPWKRARQLSRRIYLLSIKGTFARDFGLKDQINRATGSIMDNIAEGFEKGGNREFIQSLSFSKALAVKFSRSFVAPWIESASLLRNLRVSGVKQIKLTE
jgi:hypothetical protein